MGASDLEVMGTGDAAAEAPQNEIQREKIAGRSPTRIAFDRLRHDKVGVIAATVTLFFAVIAIFCPLIAKAFGVSTNSGDPATDLDTSNPLHYNYPLTGPPFHGFSWSHPLGLAPGTANDNLAYWLYGARTSLSIALVATVATTVIGVVVGLVAGTATGWLDRFISFVIDVFLSFPFLLGALALSPIIVSHFQTNPSLLNKAQIFGLIAVLTVFGWMALARLIRGSVLSLREREFVQAAEVIGVPRRSILFKEMLPNMMAPIIVFISLSLPAFVSAEAGLSFLGIGITGTPSWGQTIATASPYFENYPLFLWAPLVGVLALVLALNLLGDSVRDAFDPKTRR
jgi:peptide/nickel transport system permease protein